ncbi:MAG: EamA family transporter [Clostridia bacterium]|nr:EamA family transporter [Clostridia bacterium]
MKDSATSAKIKLTVAMTIFGTIGVFRSYIPFPSSVIAFIRGFIGMLFLIAVIAIKREKINFTAIKKNLALLLVSGALIGLNWILLFEAYRYTTVATATLCYYMAPVFVIIVSPFILKEKLNTRKILCTLAAIVGMVTISGVLTGGATDIRGILFGLGAALLYATVIILNKFISGVSDYEKTVIQLGMAAFAALPYVLLTEDITALQITPAILALLAIVGIIHTGVAYTLYFGSIEKIKAQTAAIFGYIDPVVALILSAVILKESFTWLHFLGSLMILGAAVMIELPQKNKKLKK